MPIANPTQYWTAAAQKALLNRRIVAVRYMTDQEARSSAGTASRWF